MLLGMLAAVQERNLIPCGAVHLQEATIAEKLLDQPLSVHASGIAVAHPEKAKDPNARAVNRKYLGWGGEDAYFYDSRQVTAFFASSLPSSSSSFCAILSCKRPC